MDEANASAGLVRLEARRADFIGAARREREPGAQQRERAKSHRHSSKGCQVAHAPMTALEARVVETHGNSTDAHASLLVGGSVPSGSCGTFVGFALRSPTGYGSQHRFALEVAPTSPRRRRSSQASPVANSSNRRL